MKKAIFAAALLVCMVGSGFSQTVEEHRLKIVGSVELAVAPDHASFSFSVSRTEPKLSGAVKIVREKVNDITKALKKSGLTDENIRTSYFSSGPKYEEVYSGNRQYDRKLVGYQATVSVQVDLDDLTLVEPLIILVSEYEPSELSNVRFSLKNYEKIKKDALRLAFKKAKEKALILTEESGCELGSVIEMDATSAKTYHYEPTPFNASYSIETEQIEVDNTSPGTFFPGDIKVSASVKVIFGIK